MKSTYITHRPINDPRLLLYVKYVPINNQMLHLFIIIPPVSLIQLTMGGWCYELPGFITAMTLDVPQESPWEIGINTEGLSDSTVKELPQ